MPCTSVLAIEEKNAFESQNGVAVFQTSKIKLGGHCICNFGHVPVLLKTWVFWTVLQTRPKKQKQNQKQNYAGVVLSQNVVTACTLLNCHNLPCVVPVICLTFRLQSERGNLFKVWGATLASLRDESNCWVYSEMLLSSSSGLPWKTDPAIVTMCGLLPVGKKDSHHLPVLHASASERPLLVNITIQLTAHDPPWAMLCWME